MVDKITTIPRTKLGKRIGLLAAEGSAPSYARCVSRASADRGPTPWRLVLLGWVAACGSEDGGARGASVRVVAREGARIETPAGTVLEIPPGSLAQDTVVSVHEASLPDPDGEMYFGARFEPDGVELSVPATLRLPLPGGWRADTAARYDFRGNDPTYCVEQEPAPTLESGFAVMPVSHFSGVICGQQCHAGTLIDVFAQLEARGCNSRALIAEVLARYPGVDIPDAGCGSRGTDEVQAVLDTFFVDRMGFDTGVPIPEETLAALAAEASAGALVVLAFGPGRLMPRQGPNNFYPGTFYAHTASLERRGGAWQTRNYARATFRWAFELLGGNVFFYPLDRLNEFRDLPQGVALEEQICGGPGCLASSDANSYGLDIYTALPTRVRTWTAVRIYVADPARIEALCGGAVDPPRVPTCPESFTTSDTSFGIVEPTWPLESQTEPRECPSGCGLSVGCVYRHPSNDAQWFQGFSLEWQPNAGSTTLYSCERRGEIDATRMEVYGETRQALVGWTLSRGGTQFDADTSAFARETVRSLEPLAAPCP